MRKIGFVLLTHTKPHQIERLVSRLDEMFDAPPIVCHHDWDKARLDEARYPANVRFVRPHVQTSWAAYSVVEATIEALRQLHAGPDAPMWTVLLSGSDYPASSAQRIIDDLDAGEAVGIDAFVQHRLVRLVDLADPKLAHFAQRYLNVPLHLPLRRGQRIRARLKPYLSAPFVPFSRAFRCYVGSQWFTVNHRAVHRILSTVECRPRLGRHYRRTIFSEESLLQSILANAHDLRLSGDHHRYVDFPGGSAHPKILTLDDFPAIVASGAHFARKVDMDAHPDLLDALDRHVGIDQHTDHAAICRAEP